MMRSVIRLCLATLLLVSRAADAGEAQERLDRFLAGLASLRAEFVQTVHNQDAVEESHGTLFLVRPGKFRLHYDTPYEQLYVADGKRVWLYDKDLAQVTVKPQSAALGSTPALLLSSTEPLSKRFVVSEPGARDGLDWVELKPREQDAAFESVRLGLVADGTLKVMDMADSFGQHTRIEFSKLERNVKIDPAQFRFTPPKGVDVIGEGE